MLQGKFQADAIWWSFPISSALATLLSVIYYKYGGWRTERMLAEIGATGAESAPVESAPVESATTP
jgi:hypothetical protein